MDVETKGITVSVKLSQEDLSDMNMLYYKVSKKKNKRIRYIITTIVIIIAVIIGIVKASNSFIHEVANDEIINSQTSRSEGTTLPIILFVLFAFIIILKLSIPVINKYSARKQYESNKLVQQETEYSVSSEGVQISSECLQLRWYYKDIYRVVETMNYIMLFESTRVLRLIPKRCFLQEVDRSTFIQIMKEHLSPEKYEYYKV